MKLNTQITFPTLILGLVIVAIPFTANWNLPLLNGTVVRWIENGQALWLLFGAMLPLAISGLYHALKARSNFGFGQPCGGWYCWGEALVGAVTISRSSLDFCSELSLL